MNLNERLIQCRKDKEAIEQQEKQILEQMKEETRKFKLEDVVRGKNGERVINQLLYVLQIRKQLWRNNYVK